MSKIKDTLCKYASILSMGFITASCVSNDTMENTKLQDAIPPEMRQDSQVADQGSDHKPSDYVRDDYLTRDQECVVSDNKCSDQKMDIM